MAFTFAISTKLTATQIVHSAENVIGFIRATANTNGNICSVIKYWVFLRLIVGEEPCLEFSKIVFIEGGLKGN